MYSFFSVLWLVALLASSLNIASVALSSIWREDGTVNNPSELSCLIGLILVGVHIAVFTISIVQLRSVKNGRTWYPFLTLIAGTLVSALMLRGYCLMN